MSNYRDIITHVPDLDIFRAEVAGSSLFYAENDSVTFTKTSVPVQYNGDESVCLIRLNDSELIEFNSLTSIVSLGECVGGEYVFNNETDQLTYERVYGISEDKPYKLGLFA